MSQMSAAKTCEQDKSSKKNGRDYSENLMTNEEDKCMEVECSKGATEVTEGPVSIEEVGISDFPSEFTSNKAQPEKWKDVDCIQDNTISGVELRNDMILPNTSNEYVHGSKADTSINSSVHCSTMASSPQIDTLLHTNCISSPIITCSFSVSNINDNVGLSHIKPEVAVSVSATLSGFHVSEAVDSESQPFNLTTANLSSVTVPVVPTVSSSVILPCSSITTAPLEIVTSTSALNLIKGANNNHKSKVFNDCTDNSQVTVHSAQVNDSVIYNKSLSTTTSKNTKILSTHKLASDAFNESDIMSTSVVPAANNHTSNISIPRSISNNNTSSSDISLYKSKSDSRENKEQSTPEICNKLPPKTPVACGSYTQVSSKKRPPEDLLTDASNKKHSPCLTTAQISFVELTSPSFNSDLLSQNTDGSTDKSNNAVITASKASDFLCVSPTQVNIYDTSDLSAKIEPTVELSNCDIKGMPPSLVSILNSEKTETVADDNEVQHESSSAKNKNTSVCYQDMNDKNIFKANASDTTVSTNNSDNQSNDNSKGKQSSSQQLVTNSSMLSSLNSISEAPSDNKTSQNLLKLPHISSKIGITPSDMFHAVYTPDKKQIKNNESSAVGLSYSCDLPFKSGSSQTTTTSNNENHYSGAFVSACKSAVLDSTVQKSSSGDVCTFSHADRNTSATSVENLRSGRISKECSKVVESVPSRPKETANKEFSNVLQKIPSNVKHNRLFVSAVRYVSNQKAQAKEQAKPCTTYRDSETPSCNKATHKIKVPYSTQRANKRSYNSDFEATQEEHTKKVKISDNLEKKLFYSKDSKEIADLSDPKWELMRLRRPGDFFDLVRKLWRSKTLPNPHEDLTCRFVTAPYIPSEYYVPGKHTGKSTECIAVYDKRIVVVQKKLSDIQKELLPLLDYNRQRYNNKNKARVNYLYSQRSYLKNVIKSLQNAKYSLEIFYRFYKDAAKEINYNFLTEYQNCEAEYTKKIVEGFVNVYSCSK